MIIPKISIITVCFNDLENLKRTLHSINEQTYTDFQSVIVDGNSLDGTPEFLSSFCEFPVDYISEPDRGLYDAMNKGIDLSIGTYLIFLNAGDIFYDHTILEKLVKSTTGHDVVYGNAIKVNEHGEYYSQYHKVTPNDLTWHSFIKGMVVCHQSILVAKKYVQYFNTKYKISADLDWAIRSLQKTADIYYLDTIICKFQTGGISSKRKFKSWVERFEIMVNHYGLLETIRSHLKISLPVLGHKFVIDSKSTKL